MIKDMDTNPSIGMSWRSEDTKFTPAPGYTYSVLAYKNISRLSNVASWIVKQ
jgi:hypothetical protein